MPKKKLRESDNITLWFKVNGAEFRATAPTVKNALKKLEKDVGQIKTKGILHLEKDGKVSRDIWLNMFRIRRIFLGGVSADLLEKRLNILL